MASATRTVRALEISTPSRSIKQWRMRGIVSLACARVERRCVNVARALGGVMASAMRTVRALKRFEPHSLNAAVSMRGDVFAPCARAERTVATQRARSAESLRA